MQLRRSIFFIMIFIVPFTSLKSQSVEYFIKASFIEKIARYTEWETNVPKEYFIIGVLGKSPFFNELDNLAKKTKIKGLPVKIKYIDNIEKLGNCQLLFVCSSEKKSVSQILKFTENKNILLIGDTQGYGGQGVHFNFYFVSNNTIHFEINVKALDRSKLKPDMQLLSIGKIIN